MTEPQLAAGRQAAGRYLRELLLRPADTGQSGNLARSASRPGAINHLAVADVLAHHLWNCPARHGQFGRARRGSSRTPWAGPCPAGC